MKLRNKKTGEIINNGISYFSSDKPLKQYNSLAELNEDWEDYEEPKEYWFISDRCKVFHTEDMNMNIDKDRKSFGNYFETKEEAEKAVEKFKAWKRLKDKGFKFDGWYNNQNGTLGDYLIYANSKDITDVIHDLDLLFGEEE